MGGVFPLTVINANADDSLTDRTNVNMDYKYDKTLEQVQREARDEMTKLITNKDNGDIKWKHVSFLSGKTGDIREKLTSTDPDDKYIVLDKNSKVQLGRTAYETVEITTDKVFDLNGHKIQVNDIRNKADGSDKYYQSDNSAHFNTVMFSITSGATLTIIDSSEEKTGEIYINAYMVNPYKHSLKRYTTRDIFEVDDGNLVIYGGTFQAGRSKAQGDSKLYDKIKAVVGSAVALATDVAGYATGINPAMGVFDDVSFNKKRELDKLLKESQENDNPRFLKGTENRLDHQKRRHERQRGTEGKYSERRCRKGQGGQKPDCIRKAEGKQSGEQLQQREQAQRQRYGTV